MTTSQSQQKERATFVDTDRLAEIAFPEHPYNDTIWEIAYHKDEVYIAVCGEFTGGLDTHLYRYNPDTKEKRRLVSLGDFFNEPSDSGKPPHSKVHYSLVSSQDGKLYGATHCTGAPIGEGFWTPWHNWGYPPKTYPGFHVFSYDPDTDTIEDFGIACPKEGCRTLAIDEKRRLLYGVTYPRSHYFSYHIDKREYRDHGRTSCYNTQVIFLDKKGNTYHCDDRGYFIKFNPDKEEFERLDARIPHPLYRDGDWNILYDAVSINNGEEVIGCGWSFNPHLFKFYPETGEVVDFGRGYGEDTDEWENFDNFSHCGALVLGDDGYLYYSIYIPYMEPEGRHIIRMDMKTGEKEDLGLVKYNDKVSMYFCRAVKDNYGTLYFAEVGTYPIRVMVYKPDYIKE